MFDVLRLELGFKIDSPFGLKEKHAIALVNHWHQKGLSASTLENRLSHLRIFADLALKKKGMISSLRHYLPGVTRSRVATKDKAVSAFAEPAEVVYKAMQYCQHVGTQLWMQWQFGLRPQEAVCLTPIKNDLGDFLAVMEGTKGGRPRFIPIQTAGQRAALDAAKLMASEHNRGKTSRPGETLAQAKNRFYYVCNRIGFTRNVLGVTPHGLRHDGLQAEFKKRTGVDAPVKSMSSDIPADPNAKTIADLTKAELDQAQFAVSNLAGHNRKDAASAYLGSIPAALRRAKARAPLPAVDPHQETRNLSTRLAMMNRRTMVLKLAQQYLGKNNPDEHAATSSNGDAKPAPAIPVAAPEVISTTLTSADPSRTSRAAQPQRPVRNISTAPAREAKPAKPGLLAHFLGKKNPDDQVKRSGQLDPFSARPASLPPAGDPCVGDSSAPDRQSYPGEDMDWN